MVQVEIRCKKPIEKSKFHRFLYSHVERHNLHPIFDGSIMLVGYSSEYTVGFNYWYEKFIGSVIRNIMKILEYYFNDELVYVKIVY